MPIASSILQCFNGLTCTPIESKTNTVENNRILTSACASKRFPVFQSNEHRGNCNTENKRIATFASCKYICQLQIPPCDDENTRTEADRCRDGEMTPGCHQAVGSNCPRGCYCWQPDPRECGVATAEQTCDQNVSSSAASLLERAARIHDRAVKE